MPLLIYDVVIGAMLLGLFTWFTLMHRRNLRRAAKDARERAELHKKLAGAYTDLAQHAFGDGEDKLAATRLELADGHTELGKRVALLAEDYEEFAQWPVPRWLRQRPRKTLSA